MPRILPINLAHADIATSMVLETLQTKLGRVPNLFTTLAHSPAVLKALLSFSDALDGGRLDARQREIIALAVAQYHQCQYGLSNHSFNAMGLGLDVEAINQARSGHGLRDLDDAVADLAVLLVDQRGRLDDAQVAKFHERGLDAALIMEVVAHVAISTLTNYATLVADTAIDFPPTPT
jgi:uncharacterized peroxidase-related enzyme